MRTAFANLLDGVEVEDVRLAITDSDSSRRLTIRDMVSTTSEDNRRRLSTAATATFTILISEEEYGA